MDEQAKQELEQIRHELLALGDGQLLQVVIWAEAVERYRKRTGELLVDLELPTPKQPRIFLEIIRDIVALKTQLERLNPEILAQLGGRDQIIRYPSRYQQLLRIARLLEKLKPEERDRVGVISDIYSTNLSEYEATLERAVAGLGTATPSTSGAPGANSSQTRANPLDEAQRLLFLGGEQLEQKNYQRALELFQAALKFAPNVSLIWYNIGVALGFLNRLDEALSFYERALALDNDWGQGGNRSGALNNRGDVLRRLGRFKEALQSYRQALALDPDNPFIQSNVRTLEAGTPSTTPATTVPYTSGATVNNVVRQESPVELGGKSDGIAVNPPLLEVVPGTKVTYSFNRGHSLIGEDRNRYSWYVRNDPQSVQSRRAQGLLTSEKLDGPNRPVWENAIWDFPGRHTVVLEVRSPNGNITYYQYDQVVKETSEFLESAFNQIPAYDYERFRAGLEIKHLEIAQNGVSDQKVGIPHITSTAPNPARAGTAPNYARETYSVVPSPNAKGYRWYVRPENWDWSIYTQSYNFNGFPRTKFQDRDVLSLESNSNTASWLIASPGVYTIICQELDAFGNPLGTVAQYRQVVQDPKQFKQTEQFRQYLGQVDSDIDKIAKDKEVAIRAVYLNRETAQPMGLALFIGPDAGDPKRIKLLDLTPGASENEYGGANVEEAINNFSRDNSYPKGLIKLEIPANRKGIQSLSRTLETDGTSFLGGLASTTGWASLGLTGLGIAALVIPGAQVAVPYLFAAATAAGGISSAVSIADELQQARPSGMRIAIDIFGLASSLAVGTRAFQQIGRKGAEAAQSAGKFLIYTEFTSDAISGVLLSVEGVGQIEQILDSEGMSRSEKVTAIVRILSFLAINGGLIAYGAKDLASGDSAKPKPETGAPESANRPQNDSTPTKPAAPTSFNPPIDPKRLQELTNAIPEDLRSRVPIFADPAISGSSVRVYYQPDVSIGVGPAARAVDIQLHIATARLMVRYSGLLGKIRALRDRLINWIARNGKPPVGSVAWEAELELQKLPSVIAERRNRLSQTDDQAIRAELEAEIAELEAQVESYKKSLDEMDLSPGQGYVAAEVYLELHNHLYGVLPPAELIRVGYNNDPQKFVQDMWAKYGQANSPMGRGIRAVFKQVGINGNSVASIDAGTAQQIAEGLISSTNGTVYDVAYLFRSEITAQAVADGKTANLLNAVVQNLKSQGIDYVELQGGLRGKHNVQLATVQQFEQMLRQQGISVRFLRAIKSNELAGAGNDLEAPVRAVGNNFIVGIDIAGAEQRFTDAGMERFQQLHQLLKEKATKEDKTFVLRVHVGEGYPRKTNDSHRQIAQQNVQKLVARLELMAENGELAPDKVVIRLGHLTHATFEDLQKIQRLGIVVEANLTSNQVTRSAGSEEEVQQVLLKFLYNDNKVILNTDGGGVMGTTVPQEYDKAEKAIRKFEAGEIGIPDHQKKVIYFYDENLIPDLEEKGPTYKYKDYQHQAIPEEKKPNFNIERLKQEAERYRQEVVPKVAK